PHLDFVGGHLESYIGYVIGPDDVGVSRFNQRDLLVRTQMRGKVREGFRRVRQRRELKWFDSWSDRFDLVAVVLWLGKLRKVRSDFCNPILARSEPFNLLAAGLDGRWLRLVRFFPRHELTGAAFVVRAST